MNRLKKSAFATSRAVWQAFKGCATFVVVKSVRFYQLAISPLFGPCCRFTPTCSQYCLLAVEKYGVFIGVWKTCGRILRCNPFSRGGWDPP